MITLYVGRVGKICSHSSDPAASNRLAEVIAVGPTFVLGSDDIAVLILETDAQWTAHVKKSDLWPLTEGQEALRAKHGMPHQFADACFRAVPGDISIDEAREAIRKYSAEFRDA
jgi:hypothetical protein